MQKMIRHLLIFFSETQKVLGKKTTGLFFCAIVIGLFWFAIEASFVYILQIFLVAINLIEKEKTILPGAMEVNVGIAITVLIVFGFLRSLIQFFRIFVSGITNQSFVRFQREKILEVALRANSKLSSHEIATLFNDTINHAGVVLMRGSEFTVSATSFICFLFLGFYFAPYELIIALGSLVALVIPLKIFDKKIHDAGKGVNAEYSSVNRTLMHAIKNRLFLDFSGTIDRQIIEGKENLRTYEKHYTDFYKVHGLKMVVPNFLGIAILSFVSILSLNFFKTDASKLVAFFYIFLRISQTASDANSTLNDFKLYSYAFKKIKQLNTTFRKEEIISDSSKEVLTDFNEIQFKNVGFRYDEKVVLSDFNFIFKLGESVLIKGPSGAGKSTLILLLCGLIHPSEGEILIDGKRLGTKNFKSVVSYAGPDPFLIDGTIESNLLFGLSDKYSNDEIISACKKAEVWDVISAFPGGLNFHLNEQAQLSTGQKQRIALARAFLKKSEIIIFDEATSNIDFELEQKILMNVKNSFQEKLIVFISHRDTLKRFAVREIDLSKSKAQVAV